MGRRHLQRLLVLRVPSAISSPSILWDYCWRMHYGWRNLVHRENYRVMPKNAPKSIAEIDFASLIKRQYTPSSDCWVDQILYFLMLARVSDGNEKGGYWDAWGQPVTTGTTPSRPAVTSGPYRIGSALARRLAGGAEH